MYGGASYGNLAYGDRRSPLYVKVGFSLKININLEYRIYVSTEEFIDPETLQPYSGVLDEPIDFTWSMANGGSFGGFITGRGTTVINNMDARFDTLTQRYSTDGQPVEIRLGRVGTRQSLWPVVLRGLSSGEFIDDATFEITTEDNAYKFDVPAQANVYGGTGGLDGTADLANKPRPLVYGWVQNIEGALVIPTEFLYQVHDGPVQAISAVYDQAVLLTFHADYATVALLRAATIPSGKYGTCLAEGYFRLNQDVTPQGAVTADVQGDKTGGVFAQTTVDIIRALINRSTALKDPDDLYLPSLLALNVTQPAPVGRYISSNETLTVAAVIGELISGIGGYAGFRREGKFYMGRLDAPLGPPTRRFDQYNFDPNPKKQKLPDGIWPPPAKWLVGYQKNYTVQTDVQTNTTSDHRSFVAVEYRYSIAEAPAIKIDHPFGKDPDPVQALFRDKVDADAEAARRLALYRASRGLYSIGVSDRDAALLNVGEQIFVKHNRGDLVQGRFMIVVEIQHKGSDNAATIQAYG